MNGIRVTKVIWPRPGPPPVGLEAQATKHAPDNSRRSLHGKHTAIWTNQKGSTRCNGGDLITLFSIFTQFPCQVCPEGNPTRLPFAFANMKQMPVQVDILDLQPDCLTEARNPVQ